MLLDNRGQALSIRSTAMLAEIYMLRLEAAARATATATTSSRFVPITLPALPHQTSTCVSPTSKPGMTTA